MKELYHILCGHIATDTYHHSVGSWGPATLLEQNMSPPKVCLKLSVPFSQAGICIRSLEGYIHIVQFFDISTKGMELHGTQNYFWPYNENLQGAYGVVNLPVTCLRDSEDPKITSPKLLAIQILQANSWYTRCHASLLFFCFKCISFPGAWASERTAPNATHGGIYFGHTKLQRLELRHSQS